MVFGPEHEQRRVEGAPGFAYDKTKTTWSLLPTENCQRGAPMAATSAASASTARWDLHSVS